VEGGRWIVVTSGIRPAGERGTVAEAYAFLPALKDGISRCKKMIALRDRFLNDIDHNP
jgi:hypothetical protein